MKFLFGQSEYERVEVDVFQYERERNGAFYEDDNWIKVQIFVIAGVFQGRVSAVFLTEELFAFASKLRPLYETLEGTAEFKTIEDQLYLKLKGDGKGHISLEGAVIDRPGIGNVLSFKLEFDQSELANSIRELEKVLTAFPIRKI
jgi:hypothetical protein